MTFAMGLLAGFWAVLAQMAPYLLFGFLVAGILAVFLSPETVERHLGGKGFLPVLKASAFGVPLPLCSCGVIPVTASLRRHGASRGAATAFLLSTPQTGIDSIFVTYALLGPLFALYRPLSALVTGLVGGSFVNLFGEGDQERAADAAAPPCTDACCSEKKEGSVLGRILSYGFDSLPRDIGRPLLVGLAVAALLGALVPDDVFQGALGSGPLAMVLMMAVGIPIYVCATASIPVAAVLIAKGVSPGTALVFLMTGPATNAAALATLWKVLGRRTASIYLASVAGCALASGLIFDALVASMPGVKIGGVGHLLPGWATDASAIVLLLVLARPLFVGGAHGHAAADAHDHDHGAHDGHDHGPACCHDPHCGDRNAVPSAEEERLFTIEGLHCSHCVSAVERALRSLPGIHDLHVDMKGKELRLVGHDLEREEIYETIDELGYSIALKAKV